MHHTQCFQKYFLFQIIWYLRKIMCHCLHVVPSGLEHTVIWIKPHFSFHRGLVYKSKVDRLLSSALYVTVSVIFDAPDSSWMFSKCIWEVLQLQWHVHWLFFLQRMASIILHKYCDFQFGSLRCVSDFFNLLLHWIKVT